MKMILFLVVLPGFGQVAPRGDETLGRYKQRVNAHYSSQGKAVAKRKVKTTLAAIAAQPTTTKSTTWADRTNQALTDFLPLFQFAVNAIDTNADQDAVTASFNPIRHGKYGVIQLGATASKPEVAFELLALLPESIRDEQEAAITNRLDDLSDLTCSLSYGYQRSGKNKNWDDVGRLWGRDYAM